MQSASAKPLSIILNRDELLVFMAIVGVSTMNGLEDEPLVGLSDLEIEKRMNSGEQSLLSRGLMRYEQEDNLVLNDVLVALVGGSIIPDATYLVSIARSDGSAEPHYFSATPEILVEHFSQKPGVFTFERLPDTKALRWRIGELLAPLSQVFAPSNNESHQLPAAVLRHFMECVENKDQEQGMREIGEAGVTQETAAAIADDYENRTAWVGMTAWGLRDEEPQGGNSLMAIMGDERCWLVENVDGKPDHVSVRSASAEDCEKVFLAMVEPLERALVPAD